MKSEYKLIPKKIFKSDNFFYNVKYLTGNYSNDEYLIYNIHSILLKDFFEGYSQIFFRMYFNDNADLEEFGFDSFCLKNGNLFIKANYSSLSNFLESKIFKSSIGNYFILIPYNDFDFSKFISLSLTIEKNNFIFSFKSLTSLFKKRKNLNYSTYFEWKEFSNSFMEFYITSYIINYFGNKFRIIDGDIVKNRDL